MCSYCSCFFFKIAENAVLKYLYSSSELEAILCWGTPLNPEEFFLLSSEFTAVLSVLTLLVSAARCWIKRSVDNVYIRPPNTDSQSRGSRLSILPAGRHGARQAMVFVLFCWRLDLEDGGRNTASHQQPCIRSLAIFFRYLIKLVGHPFGWIALDFLVDLLFCYILGLLFHTLLWGNFSWTGCRPYI